MTRLKIFQKIKMKNEGYLIPFTPGCHPPVSPSIQLSPSAAIGTQSTAPAPAPKATGLL